MSLKKVTKYSERDFLIMLATKLFKSQYGRNIPISCCDVRSITPSSRRELGYEIVTTRFDDFLRMRLYFDFGDETKFVNYRIENEQGKDGPAQLDDEVYVAYGTVERYYKTEGIYRFRWMTEDVSRYDVILAEADGLPILSEDGEFIVAEGGN